MKKRIIKIISFLIIAFFIFQLLPSTFSGVEGFQSHAPISKAKLSSDTIKDDVLVIARVDLKPFIQINSIKHSSSNLHQISGVGVFANTHFFQEQSFDFRKSIKQSIPQHFHGGKYKHDYFAI